MAFKYTIRKKENTTGYAELKKKLESGLGLNSEELGDYMNAGRTTEYDFPGRADIIKRIKDIKVDEE